jgi:hypothetical protein
MQILKISILINTNILNQCVVEVIMSDGNWPVLRIFNVRVQFKKQRLHADIELCTFWCERFYDSKLFIKSVW